MYTNASLAKIQANRQKEEQNRARNAQRERDDVDDFKGPDPGYDQSFVSRNVGMKPKEADGLSATPMQLLELQAKEDAMAEMGVGAHGYASRQLWWEKSRSD